MGVETTRLLRLQSEQCYVLTRSYPEVDKFLRSSASCIDVIGSVSGVVHIFSSSVVTSSEEVQ